MINISYDALYFLVTAVPVRVIKKLPQLTTDSTSKLCMVKRISNSDFNSVVHASNVSKSIHSISHGY